MIYSTLRQKQPNKKLTGSPKGDPMARDPQAALVALNRFGFGARGGASGDFVKAASDPRGFVKADLSRPDGALLEAPGLQSTPALAQAVFAYQFEIVQARNAAAKSAPTMQAAPPADIAGKAAAMETKDANAAMAAADAVQPPKPAPEPPNIIQKTYRAEALARLRRAVAADCGLAERLVVFWSNHFCISAGKGGIARMWAGSFEREAIRPHVLGRFGERVPVLQVAQGRTAHGWPLGRVGQSSGQTEPPSPSVPARRPGAWRFTGRARLSPSADRGTHAAVTFQRRLPRAVLGPERFRGGVAPSAPGSAAACRALPRGVVDRTADPSPARGRAGPW